MLFAAGAITALTFLLATPATAQTITRVSTPAALQSAINSVTAGGIIEMAAGTYNVTSMISIDGRPRFTIRAAIGASVTLSGGGVRQIMNINNSSVTLERLVFKDGVGSTSPTAGGVFVVNSAATIVGCSFLNNGRSNNGGAGGAFIYQSTVFFVDSTWSGNTSKSFGAAMVIAEGEVYIHNSLFLNNRTNYPGHDATAVGGAIHMNGGVLRVTNTRFEGNQAGAVGGALYVIALFGRSKADVVVANSTFVDNVASNDPAVTLTSPAIGGAVHVESDVKARFYNTRFVTNSARQGGAFSSYRADVEIADSVFQGNAATGTATDEGYGGAIIALSDEIGSQPDQRPMKLVVRDTLIQGRFASVTTTARQGGCLFLGGDSNHNWGLGGVPQQGNSATNRAPVELTRVVLDDCHALGDANLPGVGGALLGTLLALTVTDSLIIDSDARGPELSATFPAGGGFALFNNSTTTITGTTFARNSAVLGGGALWVYGGTLNVAQSNLIENSLSNGWAGSAVKTSFATAGGGIPAIAMTGLIQSSIISNNSGNGPLYEVDSLSSAPFNLMQYSSNTIFPAASVYYNPNTGLQTVSQLNSLALHGLQKAPASNSALGTAPVVGAILAVPPARLPSAAAGDSTSTSPAYLGYAWSGASNATLDAQTRSGNSGLEAAGSGSHTLSVASVPFGATIDDAPLPRTALTANPTHVSGGSANLAWSTLGGTFVDQAIDQGVALPAPAPANGSVSVAPASTTAFRGLLVSEEGGALSGRTIDRDGATDLIFRDGFEGGDLSAWSSSSIDGGDLGVSGSAALAGTSFGLRAVINDQNPLFVRNDSPNGESRYRARFYFDPNGFDPGEAESHFRTRVLIAHDSADQRVVTIVVQRRSGVYAVAARVRLDSGSRADTSFVTIGAGPHAIEFDWQRASGAGANNGAFELSIDGGSAAVLTGLDNDASTIDYARMGPLSLKTGASGMPYLDEFESRRALAIGPLP